MKFFILGLMVTFGYFFGNAQQLSVHGTVYDADSKVPLEGATVNLIKTHYNTNADGQFVIENISVGTHKIIVSMLNYDSQKVSLTVTDKDIHIEVLLERNATKISEIKLFQKSRNEIARESSAITMELTKDFLNDNRENTLMQSLQNLPGIQAMGIGVGQSKPVIRGLGFNRVVVSQYGIKHEAQQWGSDHGLEIDQNDAGEVQIIKGPASLLYGSDAVGGVINIRPVDLPAKNTFTGTLNLFAESNNDLLGATLGIQSKKGKWYYRGRVTWNDYGDYKVPADRIVYENYVFNLHEHHLRNTAGNEKNASVSVGFAREDFRTETFISNFNAKNGFFANAHGLEVRTSEIDYDASSRDIDLPYHIVNHFKIVNNTSWNLNNHRLKLNFGFQNNIREEHSEPVPHGYMPKPDGTLDRRYVKNTYSLEIQDEFRFSTTHTLILGSSTEYQHNQIGGWGFLIPAYERFSLGIYVYDKYKIIENLFLHSGLRYDFGTVHTKAYSDWYPSETDTTPSYLQRADNSNLNFGNFSGGLGLSYINGQMNYKINLGKSFRMPLANELSSDGVNYHMFRYEKGNMNLRAENAYQLDTEISFNNSKWYFTLTPFITYFDNYIYLNPTSNYYESLQVYEYTHSKVLRTGGELSLGFRPFPALNIDASAEYVRSWQKSGTKKNFTLPFSPPFSSLISANYSFGNIWQLNNLRLKVDFRVTAKQTQIVPPEEITGGYHVLDLALSTDINLFGGEEKPSKLRVKVNNVMNRKYFDHISFYRLIDVPQPGRNVSLSLEIPL